MARKLSERAYAQHRGCARSTVQAARRTGRLHRSVSTDERGRIWIDPELADREWQASTHEDRAPLTGPTAPSGKRSPRPVLPVSAPRLVLGGLDEPGRPFVGVRIDLGPFVAGAASALREAGREPTREALRAAVEAMGDAGWWVAVLAALHAAFDEQVPTEGLDEMWEAEGRAAVLGEETDHGAA